MTLIEDFPSRTVGASGQNSTSRSRWWRQVSKSITNKWKTTFILPEDYHKLNGRKFELLRHDYSQNFLSTPLYLLPDGRLHSTSWLFCLLYPQRKQKAVYQTKNISSPIKTATPQKKSDLDLAPLPLPQCIILVETLSYWTNQGVWIETLCTNFTLGHRKFVLSMFVCFFFIFFFLLCLIKGPYLLNYT